MGKDVEPCCETCKLFGDAVPVDAPAAAPVMHASFGDVRIVVLRGGVEQLTAYPTTAVVNVGRGANNDLVLPDGAISRRQCQIAFRDGHIVVTDTRSTCGTVVGGHRIVGPTRLPDDGLIHVGNYQLRVVRR